NLNSVVWVEPDGYNRPARLGDGHITRSGVHHNPKDLRDRNPIHGKLYLRLRTRKDDVAQVLLFYRQSGRTQRLEMTPFVSDALYT
ncbi:alpha amylase N-terminal ig-like domain-containing protein, partial [Acinetobacter baumannii]